MPKSSSTRECTAPSQEITQRVREVREKYRFGYVESVDLRIPGDPTRMSVGEKGILIGSRRSAGDSFVGTVFLRPLTEGARFAKVIDDFPTGTTGPCARMIPAENSIVYTRLVDGQILPMKYDPSTERETAFEPLQGNRFTNISSVKGYGGVLVFSDVFSHIIVEYTTTGRLIREINLPEGYEYPSGVEKIDDSSYVVVLQQDHAKKNHPEYSKGDMPSQSYMILVDHSGNVVEDLTDVSKHIFAEEALRGIVSDRKGNYFLLTASHVIKASKSFERIYEADLPKCSRRFPDTEPRLTKSAGFFNLEYLDGKLYLLEPMINKKIYVFNVG
jgi:hypothetical protein